MKKLSVAISIVVALTAIAILGVVVHNKGIKSEIPPKEPIVILPKPIPGDLTSFRGHTINAAPQPIKLLEPPNYKVESPSVISSPVAVNNPPAITGNSPVSANLSVQQPDRLYDPNSSYTYALGDLLTIPEYDRPYIRYISLYNIPPYQRQEVAAVISWMVNSLSTRKKMYVPEFVGASNGTVIRLDIRHYDWNPEAWEALGLKGSGVRPFPEPYFHIMLEKPILERKKVKKEIVKNKKVFNGYDQQGRPQFKNQEIKEIVIVEEDVADRRNIRPDPYAPWLDALAVKTLISQTGSNFPMFRADWFLVNVSVAPAYYDFLKLGKNDKDFEKLIFADEKLAEKARSQDKAVVVTSMVARNNRTLNRSPTFTGGYYWVSHDTLKSVNDRNYVQFILNEKFDATEDIGTLPNGLQAYFLTDGKGNRLDFANPDIAIDNTAVDRIVRTGRSCMVCHADGIRPINDEVRALTRKLQNREQIALLIARKRDALRIEDLFSSDLDAQIVKDQNLYREAVAKATGLQSEVISRVFNNIYNYYAEELLTVNSLSREVGINFSELQPYITASKDNLVLGLIKTPTRPIRRDQWEASFQRFMIVIMARKQGLDHADPFPTGPLITLPKSKP